MDEPCRLARVACRRIQLVSNLPSIVQCVANGLTITVAINVGQ